MYKHYRVLGCKIEFEGIVETAGAGAKIFLCPLPSSAAVMQSWNEADENKRNKSLLATNQRRFRITRYLPVNVIQNVRKSLVHNEEEYSADVGFNPTYAPQWQVGVAGLDATAGTVTVVGRVRLTYYAKMYQVKAVSAS